jgi:hypothetical protein
MLFYEIGFIIVVDDSSDITLNIIRVCFLFFVVFSLIYGVMFLIKGGLNDE